MEPSKPIETGSSFGIPKWMRRKAERYEVEDFIVSPPSSEESFFQLRYGHNHGRRQSTYDRIESEIPLEVQNSDVSVPAVDEGDYSPLGDFSKFELSWERTDPVSSGTDTTSDTSIKPLIVLPLRFLQPSEPAEKIQSEEEPLSDMRADVSTPAGQLFPSSTPETPTTPVTPAPVTPTPVTPEADSGQEKEVGLSLPIGSISPSFRRSHDYHKSLLEKVHNIPITPIATPMTTPLTTPGCTPQGSPVFKRKISTGYTGGGVIMEEGSEGSAVSKSHYFFTGSSVIGSGSSSTTPTAMDSATNTASNLQTNALQSDQLEAAAKAAAALDPRAMGMKRRARPKASALREMNFWAPTSM